jgi:hypothetical protein
MEVLPHGKDLILKEKKTKDLGGTKFSKGFQFLNFNM